jgi:hypothetical protein
MWKSGYCEGNEVLKERNLERERVVGRVVR